MNVNFWDESFFRFSMTVEIMEWSKKTYCADPKSRVVVMTMNYFSDVKLRCYQKKITCFYYILELKKIFLKKEDGP